MNYKTILKYSFLGLVPLIISCGGEKVENENLNKLNSERDSLKGVLKEVNEQLLVIENKISSLDTTKKYPIVTLDSVQQQRFEHFFEIHGNVEVEGNASLYPEVPGTVDKIFVSVGSTVKQGDPLVSLDASTMRSGLKELESSFELVNKIYEKQASLWKQNIGSEMQYLEAKSNKESLEQKIITTKKQLDMYTIRAPFNGVVDDIMPNIGESANPAMPIARVINLSKVYIEADVSERYLESVKKGTIVKVHFPGINEEIISKIERVGDFINPANRTFKIRVVVENTKGNLKPNLLAVVKIRDFYQDDAFVVPAKVIQQDRSGNDYFYTLEQKGDHYVVKRLEIKTGMSYKGSSIIIEGVNSVVAFVDKGARSVKPGDIVEIK